RNVLAGHAAIAVLLRLRARAIRPSAKDLASSPAAPGGPDRPSQDRAPLRCQAITVLPIGFRHGPQWEPAQRQGSSQMRPPVLRRPVSGRLEVKYARAGSAEAEGRIRPNAESRLGSRSDVAEWGQQRVVQDRWVAGP